MPIRTFFQRKLKVEICSSSPFAKIAAKLQRQNKEIQLMKIELN
jgi:hypothetical protein